MSIWLICLTATLLFSASFPTAQSDQMAISDKGTLACDARNASKKIEFQCYSALTTIMTCHRFGSTNILGFVLGNIQISWVEKTLFAKDKSWAAFVPLSSQLRRRKSDWRTPNYFWWEKGTVIYWSCCNRRTTPFLCYSKRGKLSNLISWQAGQALS